MTRRFASALLALLTLFGTASRSAFAQAPPQVGGAVPVLTKPPKLKTFVEAQYPEEARAAGKPASVVLQIAISAAGTVDQAVVKESAGPAFDAAALAAVKQFVFEPAEIDGKPAAIRILYRYDFVLKEAPKTTAVFEGVVRSKKTKEPLENIVVEIAGGKRAITDAQGKFHFDDVAPGKFAVSLSGDAITDVRTEETFEAGKRVDATYDIEPKTKAAAGEPQDDLEIVVTAPALAKKVVSTAVAADQGRKVAGTGGDVLKVVENLPGVGRPAAGSSALVVWGAAPQDTRIYIDGVRVPVLYHDGGLRSVISSDFVRTVELAPGGYGSEYGRGLGGLVTVELRPLEDDGFHGAVMADIIDASAMVKASVTDKFRVAIAFRKSYLDALVPLVTSNDIGEFFPIPRYYDGQARAVYAKSQRESIELGGMLSSDAVARTVASADPTQQKSETTTLGWNRIYVKYKRELDDGATVTLTPAFGTDSSTLVDRFGGTPTELDIDSKIATFRAEYRGRPQKNVTVTAGVDVEGTSSTMHRAGSVTSPAREGDIRVFGQPPSDQINTDDWSAFIGSLATFGELDAALFDGKLHITPGLRFEPFFVNASRRTPVVGDTPSIGAFTETTAVEPRIASNVELGPRVRLKAAYGFYHEPPAPEDLSAVFGNPLLDVSQAHQFLVGGSVRLTNTLSVETTGFYAVMSGLAARNPSPAPLLAQALLQIGSGRAYGVQFLVRQELMKGFFGWLSYSLVRSERQDAPDASWRLFDYDQTHVLTALGSYELPYGFEIGARFRVATGFPRTPVIGSYYDARLDTFQPIFGAQNSERIPPFVQLDARVSKHFHMGKTELETYVDVQNVTDRANPEEIVYSRDYSQRAFITGLPILPVAGARFSW